MEITLSPKTQNLNIDLTPTQKIGIGINNPRGYSAYQIAVNHGFVGTEEEWLASLQGKDGANGKDGSNGKDGKDGKDGVIPQEQLDKINENAQKITEQSDEIIQINNNLNNGATDEQGLSVLEKLKKKTDYMSTIGAMLINLPTDEAGQKILKQLKDKTVLLGRIATRGNE